MPIGSRVATLLDGVTGYFVEVDAIRHAFEAMSDKLGLPKDREAGTKLIRRSVAHLAREALSERDWIERQIMLGHRRPARRTSMRPSHPATSAARSR